MGRRGFPNQEAIDDANFSQFGAFGLPTGFEPDDGSVGFGTGEMLGPSGGLTPEMIAAEAEAARAQEIRAFQFAEAEAEEDRQRKLDMFEFQQDVEQHKTQVKAATSALLKATTPEEAAAAQAFLTQLNATRPRVPDTIRSQFNPQISQVPGQEMQGVFLGPEPPLIGPPVSPGAPPIFQGGNVPVPRASGGGLTAEESIAISRGDIPSPLITETPQRLSLPPSITGGGGITTDFIGQQPSIPLNGDVVSLDPFAVPTEEPEVGAEIELFEDELEAETPADPETLAMVESLLATGDTPERRRKIAAKLTEAGKEPSDFGL